MLNSKKTKSMYLNVDVEQLKNEVGEVILQALTESGDQDFLYLGFWCDKDRDIRTRKALAWKSLNKMDKIWKSKIDESLKIMLFRATTETILHYRSQTWAQTQETIKERRLRLAGHVYRDKSSLANMTVLWQPKHGTVGRGRSGTTLVDTLLKDTEQKTTADLHSLMSHRDVWRNIIGLRGENLDRK